MTLPGHVLHSTYVYPPPNRVKDGVNGWMTYTIRSLDINVTGKWIFFKSMGNVPLYIFALLTLVHA